VKTGQTVKIGMGYRIGRGLVPDEYTGVEGTVVRVDGQDILVETPKGKCVWVLERRLEVLS
jgi:hypothetical protein